jgi:hypothetical protein
MLSDDFGEAELALIERCFADNYPAILAVAREDVEESWAWQKSRDWPN